ncbi:hypothetical protein BLNAU_1287 [Blattamonas nauphoetae]|uniref:Uncharacterized protein n=1 Tax=Blattamonas nauphoetae TaxID=2049346 RepID=A0ABQ9YIZ0_9EUKA|nr:hypothetical protein BLNAU_1287 [Blattamonas nauphoetae]
MKTMELASPAFLSLVHLIIFELVPTKDKTCEGFIEQMIPLLSCSNEQILHSSLDLLHGTLTRCLPSVLFGIIETGLFSRLPQTFFERKLHLLDEWKHTLVHTLHHCLQNSLPSNAMAIAMNRNIETETIQQTFFDKLIQPISPFLTFVTRHRVSMTNTDTSIYLAWLFVRLLHTASFHDPTTQFVLASPLSLFLTSSFDLFETDFFVGSFLTHLKERVAVWEYCGSGIQRRGRAIVGKLKEEGLSDELDVRFGAFVKGFGSTKNFVAANVVSILGGNLPFFGR